MHVVASSGLSGFFDDLTDWDWDRIGLGVVTAGLSEILRLASSVGSALGIDGLEDLINRGLAWTTDTLMRVTSSGLRYFDDYINRVLSADPWTLALLALRIGACAGTGGATCAADFAADMLVGACVDVSMQELARGERWAKDGLGLACLEDVSLVRLAKNGYDLRNLRLPSNPNQATWALQEMANRFTDGRIDADDLKTLRRTMLSVRGGREASRWLGSQLTNRGRGVIRQKANGALDPYKNALRRSRLVPSEDQLDRFAAYAAVPDFSGGVQGLGSAALNLQIDIPPFREGNRLTEGWLNRAGLPLTPLLIDAWNSGILREPFRKEVEAVRGVFGAAAAQRQQLQFVSPMRATAMVRGGTEMQAQIGFREAEREHKRQLQKVLATVQPAARDLARLSLQGAGLPGGALMEAVWIQAKGLDSASLGLAAVRREQDQIRQRNVFRNAYTDDRREVQQILRSYNLPTDDATVAYFNAHGGLARRVLATEQTQVYICRREAPPPPPQPTPDSKILVAPSPGTLTSTADRLAAGQGPAKDVATAREIMRISNALSAQVSEVIRATQAQYGQSPIYWYIGFAMLGGFVLWRLRRSRS